MRPAISRRGHQRGRKPQRFACQSERLVGIGGLRFARLGRQQDGAAAERDAGFDMTVVARNGERVQRPFEIAGACLHVEQRIDAPGELRIAPDRLLGKGPRRLVVVAAPRLEEQAAQPQELGLGTVEHRFEGAPGRRLVALELRGLRPQQGRQRFARQVAPGDAGIALGKRAVADPDSEEAARERVISLLSPPFLNVRGDGGRSGEEVAHQRPDQDQQHDHDTDRRRPDKGAGLDLIAEPLDGYRAGTIGKPGETRRRRDHA